MSKWGGTMRFSERYEATELLHENDRVQIYKAIDNVEDRTVVIKALRNETLSEYSTTKFRQEYEILDRLNHLGIVDVYDFHEGRQVYLVLEYIESEPLRHYINENGIQLDLFFDVAIKCARNLEYIHQMGVIHKDINPSNIMYDNNAKKLTIIDFNISEVVDHESQGFCSPNILQGTLGYISPEQTGRMNRLIDYRSDFYSMGVMLYELLTGQKPFTSHDRLELIHSHIAVVPKTPCQIRKDLPIELSNIIMKLIEKDASQRYQSESGLIYDLKKCESMLKNGEYSGFNVGLKDHSSRFVLTQNVYGRDHEVETLLSGYSVVHQGGSLNMFVTGYSGVGKTTIIQELFKPVTSTGGMYITGKFDQFKRDIPYAAFIEAFGGLVQMMLSENTENLKHWALKIQEAVGSSGKLLTDMLPELENIIGPQAALVTLSGLEAQNRFNYVLHRFIQVFASSDHPLVIFIDDLQWIDSASLSLLKTLLEDVDLEYIYVLCAYRDNEVSRSHPLQMTLQDVESRGFDLQYLHLDNLENEDVVDMVKDTFYGFDSAAAMAKLIYAKTNGNAFFSKQTIMRMYHDSIIRFDQDKGCWMLDETRAKEIEASSNVLEFITGGLHALSEYTKSLMAYAACLGRKFKVAELVLISGLDRAIVEEGLVEVARKNILLKSSDDSFDFSHDKVQQAVYEALNETERTTCHFKIVKLYIDHKEAFLIQENLFSFLDHIEKSGERDWINIFPNLIQLYSEAGAKSLDALAYENAVVYLNKSYEMMPQNAWTDTYDFTLVLHNRLAEAYYLTGEFDLLNQLTEIVKLKAEKTIDKSLVYGLEIQSCMSQNHHLKGVEVALVIIRDFGVDIPLQPTFDDAGAAFATVGALIQKFDSVKDLLNLQNMTDKETKAVMSILSAIVPIVFNAAPSLLPLVVCKMVELSIEKGNAIHSPFGYSLYALLLCGIIGDIQSGTEFGDLAIELVNDLNATGEMAKTYNMVALHVMHFKDHLDRVTNTLEMAYQMGLESGDHLFAGFAGHGYCLNYYFSGNELNRTRKVFENYTHSMEVIKQGTQTTFQNAYLQTIVNLLEKVDEPWLLEGEAFQESVMLEEIELRGHKTALLVTYYHKMYLAMMFRNYERAYEYARKVEENLDAGVGLILIPYYYAFDSLIRIKMLRDDASEEEKSKMMMIVSENQLKLETWRELGHFNYEHRYLVIQAEIARFEGRNCDAQLKYEEALEIVAEASYLNEEALYRELIAEYYHGCGNEELFEYYTETAYVAYKKWGASNKADRLQRNWSELSKNTKVSKSIYTIHETSSTKDINVELDLRSILKASQAIAKEIVYESLLENMLEILIENAGAEKAVVVNFLDDGQIVGARKEVGQAMVFKEDVGDVRRLGLPGQVMNYVMNAKKAVLLRSAIEDAFFASDPYIKDNKVKSMLCFPIIRQTVVIGIMYVENNLAVGAFTEQRVDVLNMLSTQISISLKNAMMYRHMEKMVHDRTVELEKKNSTLERLNNQLQVISVTDGLTQIFNRRKIDENLYYERERYMRYGSPLSIILLDIDKFKNVNDTYGHHVGDQVLVGLSELLKGSIRKVDVVGRWGGEEFMIICPNTSLKQAVNLAQTIRSIVETKRFEGVNAITSSFGVAQLNRDEDIEGLIQRVDAALYRAKDRGRNRVEF